MLVEPSTHMTLLFDPIAGSDKKITYRMTENIGETTYDGEIKKDQKVTF